VQYRVAVDGYAKLLEQEPGNARLHQEFAEALVAVGEDEDAARHIEEALILDENLWQAHELSADLHTKHAVLAFNQGMWDLTQSHLESAEAEAEEAMRLADDEPRPCVMLFLAKWLPEVMALQADPMSGLGKLGRFEELGELLKTAAALIPSYPKLSKYAIACKLTPFFTAQLMDGLEVGIWAKLDEQQRRILTSCRDELITLSETQASLKAEALLFAGISAFMMDDRKGMYEQFRASADAAPDSVVALETTVGFLAYEKKWALALKTANEIIERRPSGKAYAWIGRIHAEQRKWKLAEEAFRVALTYDDAEGIANLGLGVILLKSGAEAAEALGPLRTALEELPGQREVLVAWGVALALIGETDEARKYIIRALPMFPPSPGRDVIAKEFGLRVR